MGSPPEAVLAELGRCAIAHFACHGYSDPADPSHSRLLLHGSAEPLTVAGLAPVNLSHADLAYLSACQTAINSAARLIDEAIHLSAAFQLAGFRQVIGTPWEVEDEISAPRRGCLLREPRRLPGRGAGYRHGRPLAPRRCARRTRHACPHPLPVGRLPARRGLTRWTSHLHPQRWVHIDGVGQVAVKPWPGK
jgi:CHAT domain